MPAQPARSVESADRPATDDEELAIAALEGLMAQPPERALPILKKVLAGSQSTLVKRRALFVLAQIDAPEARQLLIQAAHSPIPELRTDAIRSIGISGDEKALDSLQDIYKTADAETKKDILQGWMIAGRKEMVYQAALNAKTEDEASDAIRMLGVMGATEELRKLSDKPNSQRGLVEALGISGDLAGLRKIAEGNGDREVRGRRGASHRHHPERRGACRAAGPLHAQHRHGNQGGGAARHADRAGRPGRAGAVQGGEDQRREAHAAAYAVDDG